MSTHEQAKRTAEADAVVRFINQRVNAGGEVMGMLNLRDYFAAKAMPALINEQVEVVSTLARLAYEIADAMLKVRQE